MTPLALLALVGCAQAVQGVEPATIAGRVIFDGSATPSDFEVLVDANGRLADVLVKLTRVQGEVPKPALDPLMFVVEIEHEKGIEYVRKNSRFRPHVAGIQVGRSFAFDKGVAQANPHWWTDLNGGFSGSLRENKRTEVGRPEVTLITCDILPRDICPGMHVHLVIIEHPWFAVSARDGSFAIEDVPEGTYGVEAWHPTLGTRVLEQATVSARDTARIEFRFQP